MMEPHYISYQISIPSFYEVDKLPATYSSVPNGLEDTHIDIDSFLSQFPNDTCTHNHDNNTQPYPSNNGNPVLPIENENFTINLNLEEHAVNVPITDDQVLDPTPAFQAEQVPVVDYQIVTEPPPSNPETFLPPISNLNSTGQLNSDNSVKSSYISPETSTQTMLSNQRDNSSQNEQTQLVELQVPQEQLRNLESLANEPLITQIDKNEKCNNSTAEKLTKKHSETEHEISEHESDQEENLNDRKLLKLSVKDLNKKLQGLPKSQVIRVKQKRRTLKNRGYAQSCRQKKQILRKDLEKSIISQKETIIQLKEELIAIKKERDSFKRQLELFLGMGR